MYYFNKYTYIFWAVKSFYIDYVQLCKHCMYWIGFNVSTHTNTLYSKLAEPGWQHHTKHLPTSAFLSPSWPPSASFSWLCDCECVTLTWWMCSQSIGQEGWQTVTVCIHPGCVQNALPVLKWHCTVNPSILTLCSLCNGITVDSLYL